MSKERIARRIGVTGKVQGVWFRGWTVEQARALGLDGWVRNRRDGSVEVVAAGSPTAVAELIARLRRGPPAARVDDVTSDAAPDIVAAGFVQEPTL